MAQRLSYRVEEQRQDETPEVVARFKLSFDTVEYLRSMSRVGQRDTIYVAFENGREYKRVKGGSGMEPY